MSILALIDNNEEFFNKRFENELTESNKKINSFQISEIKKDQNDLQGIESEGIHFQKTGISQQLKSNNIKNSPNNFFNNNIWGQKSQGEEADKDFLDKEDEEILEELVIEGNRNEEKKKGVNLN